LAAEQYEKTYRLGLSVYYEKNQLAPLISVISAYTGIGDFESAKRMIEELRKGNLKVNTPLTNSWYHFAQGRYFYRIEDYASMRKSLRSWQVFLKQISNKEMNILFQWFSAALCLNDDDGVCVAKFLAKHQDPNTALTSRLSKHSHYFGFLVKAHLYLGDEQYASDSFEMYTSILNQKVKHNRLLLGYWVWQICITKSLHLK
jgi:hypothetical protein